MGDELRRIAIWGHYHGRNLGDELVVSTICAAVRRRIPGAELVGISMTPADTEARHGMPAYPIEPGAPPRLERGFREVESPPTPTLRSRIRAAARALPLLGRLYRLPKRALRIAREIPFFWRSLRFLHGIDLVVVAGSGQLNDQWPDAWQHAYRTFRWALLARLARVPMVYPSVGAGPIGTKLGAFFIRSAVDWARYVSVRDRKSASILASIGVTRQVPYCPDMGYAYPGFQAAPAPSDPEVRRVGLNVMEHQSPSGSTDGYEAYLEKMAAFARWLLDRGYVVMIFSSQTRADDFAAAEFREVLADLSPADAGRVEWTGAEIEEIEDVVGAIARCDAIVAARFHSVLIPLALGIPVIGLAYNHKTTELLTDVGLADQCFDIDAVTVEELCAAFDRLVAEPVPATVSERVRAHRDAVEAQFDTLFGAPA
jgi:polysaccharide pyruvyl transferase WcaK-like protein